LLGAPASELPPALSSRAQAVADYLGGHGATFFDELVDATRLLRSELEDALAELVAVGLVNADSYAGLRALLVPSSKRPSTFGRRGARRRPLFGIENAGRWTLLKRAGLGGSPQPDQRGHSAELVEYIANLLLRRYGVVFWRLLEREAAWLPPWRELLRVFQRLEARGEIRGGRFVAGLSGEQFALPDAIGQLRSVRQREPDGTEVCLSGADPLNLIGNVIAGAKVPALTGSRILYRDGLPIASIVGGNFSALETMDSGAEWAARTKLLRDTEYAAQDVAEGA
jgi:ATP-dependent helicase Lhr and Lhr-like helicase